MCDSSVGADLIQPASPAREDWRAAGVLPYYVKGDASNEDTVHFLLGKELNEDGRYQWSDFGGAKEPGDFSPEETAAREFAEETLGLFAGVELTSLEERVKRSTAWASGRLGCGPAAVLSRKGYRLYLINVESQIEPLYFQLARDENDGSQCTAAARNGGAEGSTPVKLARASGEKRDFLWISAKRLLCGLGCAVPSVEYNMAAEEPSSASCPNDFQCEALYDELGHELNLLPALEVTLRSQLREALTYIYAVEKNGGVGAPVHFRVPSSVRSLFVGGVLPGDEAKIRATFGAFGKLRRITVHKRRGFAFVVFGCPQEAQRALVSWCSEGHPRAEAWHVSFADSDEAPAKSPKLRAQPSPSELLASSKKRKNAKSLGIGAPTAPWAKRRNVAASSPRASQ